MPSCSSCCETKASSKRAIRSGLPGLSSPDRSQGLLGWGLPTRCQPISQKREHNDPLPQITLLFQAVKLDVFSWRPATPPKKRDIYLQSRKVILSYLFHLFFVRWLMQIELVQSHVQRLQLVNPLVRYYTFQGLPCMASNNSFLGRTTSCRWSKACKGSALGIPARPQAQ